MYRGLQKGFTLVELMVTIAVFTILAIVAIPSFLDLRERTAVRGAGGQLISFWANARLEALKRDRPITVAIHVSGGNTCIGATTSNTGCDCFTAAACDVAQYPASSANVDQAEWHGATAVGHPTLGPTDTDDDGLATIDPKRGYLSDSDDVGGITMQSPGKNRYRLRMYVDRWARAYLCNPTDAAVTLPDYSNRTCSP